MAYYDSYQEELKTFMDTVSTTKEFADAVSKGTDETANCVYGKTFALFPFMPNLCPFFRYVLIYLRKYGSLLMAHN